MNEDKVFSKTQGSLPIFLAQLMQDQIKFADTKASWVFSILSILTGALITKVSGLEESILLEKRNMFLIGISIFFIILSFKHVLRVMYPRISKGNKEGIFYFEDIIQQTKDSYSQKGLSLSDEQIIGLLYSQTHDLSKIVSKKFRAIKASVLSTIVAVLAVILVFLFI